MYNMKKDDIKNFFIGIISSLVATAILSILSIIGSIFVIFNSGKIFSFQNFIILICIVTLVSLTFKVFYLDKNNICKPNFPALTVDYKYKKVEVNLHFITREKMTYEANYYIQALKETSYIKRNYSWTGDEIKELPIISRSQKISNVELLKDSCIRKTYLVKFVTPLQKGQEISFSLKYNLSDIKKQMDAYLKHTVLNPTEKIILRIIVPKNLIRNLVKCVYADEMTEIRLIAPEELSIFRETDDLLIYEWEILKPSLLYNYQIIWEFL